MRRVAMPPLPADDARALLATLGLTDRDVVAPLVEWPGFGHGSPVRDALVP